MATYTIEACLTLPSKINLLRFIDTQARNYRETSRDLLCREVYADTTEGHLAKCGMLYLRRAYQNLNAPPIVKSGTDFLECYQTTQQTYRHTYFPETPQEVQAELRKAKQTPDITLTPWGVGQARWYGFRHRGLSLFLDDMTIDMDTPPGAFQKVLNVTVEFKDPKQSHACRQRLKSFIGSFGLKTTPALAPNLRLMQLLKPEFFNKLPPVLQKAVVI